MTCADCGADIIVTADPGRKAAEPLCIETEHICPGSISEDCASLTLQGVTVFEGKRVRK